MPGWFADLFRLAWGLVYWNVRKAWFQRRRRRGARCPCQAPSDTGRAFETGCEACVGWSRQVRFRRVCPLLVETPDGLRCAANADEVRPFWGQTLRYYGTTLAAIYAACVLAVFVFLRSIGYPISIVHVGWPGLWYRVPQARGWFYMERANRAFAAGKTPEGLLYLVTAYDYDPGNYAAGIALAKHYQLVQPLVSDQYFRRLLRDFPAHADVTAQDWYRALLARGDFVEAAKLARQQAVSDPARANVWVRGLLFTTQRLGDETLLRELLADPAPTAVPWRQVLATELLLRAGRQAEARAALDRPWPRPAPPFTFYYRASAYARLGDTFAALEVLEARGIPTDDEARYTLQLDVLAAAGARSTLLGDVNRLLAQPLHSTALLPTIKLFCAHLIRYPDSAIFTRLMTRVDREHIAFDNETAGVWFSLLCAAGAVGDHDRLHKMAVGLKGASKGSFIALDAIEGFFRGQTGSRRATTFLPVFPLPLEVTYAMLERYPGPAATGRKP